MMRRVDTTSLRQLYDHLGIEPEYVMSSFVSYQFQERNPQEKLPETLTKSIDNLRNLATMSRNHLQIGAFEFAVGLDFLHGGRGDQAVSYFEAARQQWLFIDHLPLISLAYFGTGKAYHAAGDYRQAAAAYFKAKQCLHQAETEPHRLEKIEAERSLQSFWNDLERWLQLDIHRLRRDFSQEQDDILRADLGDIPDRPGPEASGKQGERDNLAILTLQMQPTGSMAAHEVETLIFKTVDGIEILNAALTPPVAGHSRPSPTIGGLKYASPGQITIAMENVTNRAVAFCRWLMTIIAVEANSPGDNSGNVDKSTTWFTWQAQPSYIAEFVKTFVQSATGNIPEEAVVRQLIQVIGHLAEMRLNCQLTVK